MFLPSKEEFEQLRDKYGNLIEKQKRMNEQ